MTNLADQIESHLFGEYPDVRFSRRIHRRIGTRVGDRIWLFITNHINKRVCGS